MWSWEVENNKSEPRSQPKNMLDCETCRTVLASFLARGRSKVDRELVGVPADGESVEKKGEEPRLEAVFEPSGATSAENEGAAQQVMIELQRSPEDSVTVPVSAVWTDLGGGSVVTTVTGDGDQRKVPVEVVFSADGMAAVRAVDGTLSPGASVLLGHRSNGEDS